MSAPGIAWWNRLPESERRDWLRCVGTARVADAWQLRCELVAGIHGKPAKQGPRRDMLTHARREMAITPVDDAMQIAKGVKPEPTVIQMPSHRAALRPRASSAHGRTLLVYHLIEMPSLAARKPERVAFIPIFSGLRLANGPGGLDPMRTLSKWYQLLALLTVAFVLSACGGGGSSDTATTFTVEGRVLNGVLVGSAVEVFGSNGQRLATATTDADGRYSAEVSQAGPYRLRATGGKLNDVDYAGVLEASCAGGPSCFVTPYTTVLLRLVDDHGFNQGDATALMASNLGFDGDPFAGNVPVEDFDLDAARAAIAGGDGLAEG